ncbi:LexA family transcriptional regulator [uncultured Endozoicomonas sp.]|uniref:LexA family protein n=1 Tax=uncultured Endozoicomonas sp. TaxID=432652 RepID=UPI00262A3B00|nr:LexA family transcriptional regulator [uncultured Endozoicomonas sp.]
MYERLEMTDWIDRAIQTRKAAQLTQFELADRMDATQGYVSNIERRRKGFTLDTVYKFARALGVSFNALYYGRETETPAVDGVPLLDPVSLAAWINDPTAEASQFIPCPKADRGARTFAYIVQGDAMEPAYKDGTIVYVDPDTEKAVGKNVIYIASNGRPSLRSFTKVDGVEYLKPLNSQYPAQEVEADAIYCGSVVASYKPE